MANMWWNKQIKEEAVTQPEPEKKLTFQSLSDELKLDNIARDVFYKTLDYLNDEMDAKKTPDVLRCYVLKQFFYDWEVVLKRNNAIDEDLENRGGDWVKRYVNRLKYCLLPAMIIFSFSSVLAQKPCFNSTSETIINNKLVVCSKCGSSCVRYVQVIDKKIIVYCQRCFALKGK